MSNEATPFKLLKTYPGLIHRQPMFATHGLDVDRHHFRFLDEQGQLLANDADVPDFIDSLCDMLSAVSDHRKIMLSIPESWRIALSNSRESTMKMTFVLQKDDALPSLDSTRFHFARHAENDDESERDELLLIDLQHHQGEELSQKVTAWYQEHDQLCAINVNALDDYTTCQTHKLTYCQGDFYTLPAISERKKMSPSLQTLTELLVKLQNPDIEPEELADTVNQDVALSYKLLRLINSAFFGLPREVSSTHQAIVMLGQNKIKTWASLLGLSGIDDKPVELRVVAMVRARMCELLAKYYKGQPEIFFAAGLFSTLDALMDIPLVDLVEKLPFSNELKDALLHHEGIVGQALRDTLHYEQANWAALNDSTMSINTLGQVYIDAIHWSHELNAQLMS